jgi:hypothetical protein
MSVRQQLALFKQMDDHDSPKSPQQQSMLHTPTMTTVASAAGNSPASGSASMVTTTPTSASGQRNRRIAKVHKKNDRGETPLHVAARYCSIKCCINFLF